MAGPLPISYGEIEAWARLTKNEPWAWEISAIRQMDAAYLTALARKAPPAASEPSHQIDASNGREVVGFMRQMAARKRA